MQIRSDQIQSGLKTLTPVYFVSGDEPLQLGEVTDAIRLAAKKEGYRARSVYKLQEIQERFELITPEMNVCDV